MSGQPPTADWHGQRRYNEHGVEELARACLARPTYVMLNDHGSGNLVLLFYVIGLSDKHIYAFDKPRTYSPQDSRNT